MVGRLGTLRRHLCSGDTGTTRGSGSASAGSAHSTPPQLSQNHVYDQLLQEAVNDGGEWIEVRSYPIPSTDTFYTFHTLALTRPPQHCFCGSRP
jgi:hypothetical protein